MLQVKDVRIDRIQHSAFTIVTDYLRLYIDPFKLPDSVPKGDIVLITHEHYDHCSIEDLKKVVGVETRVIMPPDCQSKILSSGVPFKEILLVRPGVMLVIGEVRIEAVYAYNINKQFHPKDNEWVGYVIECGGVRVYHAGDTDIIPEMKALKNINVALLPVSGTYTMTASEAAEAVDIFQPDIAVPMHYGTIIGTRKDAEEFAKNCKGKSKILGP